MATGTEELALVLHIITKLCMIMMKCTVCKKNSAVITSIKSPVHKVLRLRPALFINTMEEHSEEEIYVTVDITHHPKHSRRIVCR